MPDNPPLTESQKADLSKQRGQLAASISDPKEKAKYIAAQGEADQGKRDYQKLSDSTQKDDVEHSAGLPIASMKDGGDVKKTGLYKLHEGEKVLSKKDSNMAMDMLGNEKKKKSSGTKKKSAAKSKLKALHIRKASSGGFIAQHEMEPSGDGSAPQPNEEHVVPDLKALQAHLADHFGGEQESGGSDEGEGGGSPEPETEG